MNALANTEEVILTLDEEIKALEEKIQEVEHEMFVCNICWTISVVVFIVCVYLVCRYLTKKKAL